MTRQRYQSQTAVGGAMTSGQFVAEYPMLRPSWWGLNGHVQTLATWLAKGPVSTKQPERYVVPLADGDRLVIHDDHAKSWITGDRIAILLHGLCGCHDSPYVRRIAMRLRRHGIRTVRVDMRGFGTSELISRGHMHAGCSRDLIDVIEFVHQLSPISKISLIGFSLGANIVLKTLCDWADLHPNYVDTAIAVAPPIDLEYCSMHLRAFGNRMYEYYFTSRLTKLLTHRRQRVMNLVDNGLNPLPDRLVHLDDQFTAPVSGFSGARDYYRQCSTHDRLKQIYLSTIIVAAEDDPVVPREIFEPSAFSSEIEFVCLRHGGHLGFLGHHHRDPDWHWLDWRICKWLSKLDER